MGLLIEKSIDPNFSSMTRRELKRLDDFYDEEQLEKRIERMKKKELSINLGIKEERQKFMDELKIKHQHQL